MPGPPPTPKAILKARGSWRGKSRSGEPMPKVEKPSCPSFLKGEARAEWGRATRELVALGVLAKCDRGMLAVWCVAWADFVDAVAWLGQPDRDAEQVGRVQRLKRTAVEQLLKVGQLFGLSPSARVRLQVAAAADAAAGDPLEEFTGKGRSFTN